VGPLTRFVTNHRSRKFGGAVAFVGQYQELVLPMPASSIALGSKSCQHALAPFLIGRTQTLNITGIEPPSRDLAASASYGLNCEFSSALLAFPAKC
jgi:hypothetical protein